METQSSRYQLETKADLVKALTQSLPSNSFGLPDGFYRVDLLPSPNLESSLPTYAAANGTEAPLLPGLEDSTHRPESNIPDNNCLPVNSAPLNGSNGESLPLSSKQIATTAHFDISVLESAYVPLSYQEGFPSLPDGMPFWSQLDYEPLPEFNKFQNYLEQGDEGARQIFLLKDVNFSSLYLQEVAILHYWPARARSYDLFKLASFKYQQEMRAISMQNNHYILANKLLEKAKLYFDDDEFIELLTPSTAIDLLKTVVQLQRLSVGLPPGTVPNANKDAPAAAGNIEVILRNLVPQKAAQETLVEQDDGSFALSQALQDPETAAVAQELIIKIQQSNAA